MKPNFIAITVVAGLLLAATPCGWAIPPRQHSASGVIVGVNREAHTLTVAAGKDAKPLVLVWNDSTHFKHRGHAVCHGALAPGQPVMLRYRREAGRLVPREVTLRSDVATRCETSGCCAPGTVETKPRTSRDTLDQRHG